MWWQKHLVIIGIQIIAFIPYVLGSYKFYKTKKNFMGWLAIGIILDITMAILPFVIELPRMEGNQGAPWSSILFLVHISTAGIGMFGFIIMFIYLLINGVNHDYRILRKFQYTVLLRLWILGVGISLLNFLVKVIFCIRIYDFI